jgi:hypothetical protein
LNRLQRRFTLPELSVEIDAVVAVASEEVVVKAVVAVVAIVVTVVKAVVTVVKAVVVVIVLPALLQLLQLNDQESFNQCLSDM